MTNPLPANGNTEEAILILSLGGAWNAESFARLIASLSRFAGFVFCSQLGPNAQHHQHALQGVTELTSRLALELDIAAASPTVLQLQSIELHSPGIGVFSGPARLLETLRGIFSDIVFYKSERSRRDAEAARIWAEAETQHGIAAKKRAEASYIEEQVRLAALRNDTLSIMNTTLQQRLEGLPRVNEQEPWRQQALMELVGPIVMQLLEEAHTGRLRGASVKRLPPPKSRGRKRA